jgi:hypothetical protein
VAQYNGVTAPSSTDSMCRVMNARIGHGTRRKTSDATKPGCTAYVVTPVPAVRRASSCVNSTLHSLDTIYSRAPTIPRFPMVRGVGRRSASKSMPDAA